MAIYHLSAQMISRGRGQSAVAAAAYRSGEQLMDERTGEMKYYKRSVQPEAMIMAPSHAPEWIYDREKLWNKVETAEKRKDAQLAREMNIALPRELGNEEQLHLIKEYIQNEFVAKGMIADVAIHRDDQENPHVHVMLTTRDITPEGFGPKNRDWNNREYLHQWREKWADYANHALEKAGIQERISHLSNEARGLEQLPTVHLGHVAHGMEKRGMQSDRGNVNRERQEYNQLVVDLEKYRQEKQALEQKKARKQQQKEQIERFYTPEERTELKAAFHVLKVDPTFSAIESRRDQLNKWEERVNNGDQYIRWKDKTIEEAERHFKWIESCENTIQKNELTIEDLNWLNPLKIQKNRMVKERAEQEIRTAQQQMQSHEKQLVHPRQKLTFETKQELEQIKQQHELERLPQLEKNQQARKHIRAERETLQNAENALENGFVREVASLYPNHPEMRYMSYETARRIKRVHAQNGDKVIPIQNMKKGLEWGEKETKRLQEEINQVQQDQSRLSNAEHYLAQFEHQQEKVERFERNPFLLGKARIHKATREEYQQEVLKRDQYKELLKQKGVSDRYDLQTQFQRIEKKKEEIPVFQEQIHSLKGELSLLSSVLNGLERAQREMEREQQRRQQRVKGKKRKRQPYFGPEI
jgi:hypothetical protein